MSNSHKLKKCSRCEQEKSLDEFFLRKRKGRYRGEYRPEPWCKTCSNSYSLVYNKKRRKTPMGARLQKGYYIKHRWRISIQEYERLVEKQNGLCALCEKPPKPERKLVVDHDHGHHSDIKRGCRECVRGLLCDDCNRKFLSVAEHVPRLQSDIVKMYLKQRPFAQSGDDISNSAVKSHAPISEKSPLMVPRAAISFDTELPVGSSA